MTFDDSVLQDDEDRKERERVLLAYYDTFETPQGQVVLADLRRSYSDRLSYTPGDPYRTVFREGERNVVLGILQLLKMASTPEPDKSTPQET